MRRAGTQANHGQIDTEVAASTHVVGVPCNSAHPNLTSGSNEKTVTTESRNQFLRMATEQS